MYVCVYITCQGIVGPKETTFWLEMAFSDTVPPIVGYHNESESGNVEVQYLIYSMYYRIWWYLSSRHPLL